MNAVAWMMLGLSVISTSAWSASATDIGAPGQHRAVHMRDAENQNRLSQPGNAAFGAIQEVITVLEADPATDWSRVNLEALRQHLMDMDNVTLNVEVTSQEPISKGIRVSVRPTTTAAAQSLTRLLTDHGPQLQHERGWKLSSAKYQDGLRIDITTDDDTDVAKVRAFGYIGMLAAGTHHVVHHWAMATGQDAHHPKKRLEK